ncbi:hypothetical protein [Pseudomonas sp. RC10]|uniref:hypothetical protein n=1 Tax=Pseudomonas bambusae TaxID=3139142 RepID=UPI0031392C09
MKKLIAVLFCALVLTGCAGQKFSAEHRAQIKTVKVLPVQWQPGNISYFGRAQNTGMAFGGALGVAVANMLSTSPQAEIVEMVDNEKIDLGELVKQHFVAELAKNSSFKVVDDDTTADANIQLTVDHWGFHISHGFSSVIYPVVRINAVMKRGTERVWQHAEGVSPFTAGNDHGYEPDKLGTDAEISRLALDKVSELASQSLAKELL